EGRIHEVLDVLYIGVSGDRVRSGTSLHAVIQERVCESLEWKGVAARRLTDPHELFPGDDLPLLPMSDGFSIYGDARELPRADDTAIPRCSRGGGVRGETNRADECYDCSCAPECSGHGHTLVASEGVQNVAVTVSRCNRSLVLEASLASVTDGQRPMSTLK